MTKSLDYQQGFCMNQGCYVPNAQRMIYKGLCLQVCASTALFGFVSKIGHEQLFTAACLFLRAVMGGPAEDFTNTPVRFCVKLDCAPAH